MFMRLGRLVQDLTLAAAFASPVLLAQAARTTVHGLPVVPLTGERLSEAGLLLYPVGIASVGNVLYVVDTEADSIIVVLDDRRGRLLATFGRRGNGFREFEAPVSIDESSRGAGASWIIDGALRRATRVSVPPAASGGRSAAKVDRMVELAGAGAGPITSAFVDSADGIIAAGIYSSAGRFVRFGGASWTELEPRALGAESAPAGTPFAIRQHAYQTSIARHPRRDRFAAATRYADRLEIFSAGGARLAEASRLRKFDPAYSVGGLKGSERLSVGQELRYGYIAIAADSGGVFALYSGRSHLEAGARAPFGSVIEYFNWEAVLVRTFVLDADALAIAVDAAGQTLFAVVHEPLPSVIRYKLPPFR